jgi:hypothetical protein
MTRSISGGEHALAAIVRRPAGKAGNAVCATLTFA